MSDLQCAICMTTIPDGRSAETVVKGLAVCGDHALHLLRKRPPARPTQPAPDLPPDLVEVLAGIPRWVNLTGDARRKAAAAVGAAHHDHGLSIGQIAALTARSYGGIRQLLHESGVPIRPARRPERTLP